jgi:2,3-bisphosphoglycerate-independent phosphoglycerate mutase
MPFKNGKLAIVVIDGMSDIPDIAQGREQTPLEISNIPNLNRMAKEGLNGYVHSIGFWKVGGSDTSHVALLGYDPYTVYTGRGPIEVAGTGVDLEPGDVSIRCNYCTVSDESLHLVNRTAGYVREGTVELADAINGIELSDPGVKFEFRNSADYRCVVYFRGQGISAAIHDMDPSYDFKACSPDDLADIKANPRIVPCQPKDETPEAKHMAELLSEWVCKVYQTLDNHPVNVTRREQDLPPANCVMPRGAGLTPKFEPFDEKWGLKGACVAGTGLIKGIGKLTGMDVPTVPGATGYIDSDLMAKARKAVDCLNGDRDFVLVHVEGTDEVSHDKDVETKIAMLGRADEMLGYIMDNASPRTVIAALSDHTTACVKGDHTAEPSPIALWMREPTYRPDDLDGFSERQARLGSLKHIEGKTLIPRMLSLLQE